jgi:hypothetical protein
MCRVLKLEIKEPASELQELLKQQKTGFGFIACSSAVFIKNAASPNGATPGSSVGERKDNGAEVAKAL